MDQVVVFGETGTECVFGGFRVAEDEETGRFQLRWDVWGSLICLLLAL